MKIGIKNYIFIYVVFFWQYKNGGLYTGMAGVAYMLYHIAENPSFDDQRISYLEEAESYLHVPLAHAMLPNKEIDEKTGFLTGNVGVYALAVVIYKKLGSFDLLIVFIPCIISLYYYLKYFISSLFLRIDNTSINLAYQIYISKLLEFNYE